MISYVPRKIEARRVAKCWGNGQERRIKRLLVVDLDAHQGNGTAAVFHRWDRAFMFDLYERDIFPARKEPEDYPLPVGPGLAGSEYLGIVRDTLPKVIDAVRPKLVIYNAQIQSHIRAR